MNNDKKFVKVRYGDDGPCCSHVVYPIKRRKSCQMAFIALVLERFGTLGQARIEIEELKEIRAPAELEHHGREWDGRMYNGANGTLVHPLFGSAAHANGPGTKVIACTIDLEGLDVFLRTGLGPSNYGFFARDHVELIDAVPEGWVKCRHGVGWQSKENHEDDEKYYARHFSASQ